MSQLCNVKCNVAVTLPAYNCPPLARATSPQLTGTSAPVVQLPLP